MTRYDLAYLAASPVLAGALAWKSLRRGKYRQSAPAMLGRHLAREDAAQWREGCLWVHAVSVGEVMAARAMLPLLRKAYPALPLLLTTVTETGQAEAKKLEGTAVDAVRYFPADFSWVVRKFLATYRPKALLLMETELWPNVLNMVADSGAPVVTVNGKISQRSFRGYQRFGGILRQPLSRVAAFCMQTDGDAERIGILSGHPERVHVTGNCKFDVVFPAPSTERKAQLREIVGVGAGQRIVIAGSTHSGEEEIVLGAFASGVAAAVPNAVLLLVPRHPERFAAAWELVQQTGLAARRASEAGGAGAGSDDREAESPTRIVLVDRMGLLGELYAIAEIAVVAGSFVDGIGGHNLLEAAVQGIPVIHGPHMYGQPDMVRILSDAGASVCCPGEELSVCVRQLLEDGVRAAEMGRRGREAVLRNQGAAARNLAMLQQVF